MYLIVFEVQFYSIKILTYRCNELIDFIRPKSDSVVSVTLNAYINKLLNMSKESRPDNVINKI